MYGRTVLAPLAGSSPIQRVQVTLAQHKDGRLAIELRDQHYAEGIGWFDQRALDLDPRQFRQLQAVLGSRTSVLALAEEKPCATISFPGPATRRPMRPAVGDE